MLRLEGIKKSYDHKIILNDVSLTVQEGEIVSIIGPSGIGKTTLLKIIAGIVKEDAGNLSHHAKKIGYIFQEDRLLPWRSVEANIKLVNESLKDTDLDRLLDILALGAYKDMMPENLSGGMRQRVAIARAFAYKPDLIMLDEPFKSIDQFLKRQLIEDILEIWKLEKMSMLLVTHDFNEALAMSDRIYLIGGSPATIKKEIVINTPQKLDAVAKDQYIHEIMQFWEGLTDEKI